MVNRISNQEDHMGQNLQEEHYPTQGGSQVYCSKDCKNNTVRRQRVATCKLQVASCNTYVGRVTDKIGYEY